ncbi:MAG: hypothetical protein Q9191_005774 [Dirinaria sp. TL-2023a]
MSLKDLDSDYFAAHARQSVRFVESIQNLQEERSMERALFLEMGPHPITLPMLRATLSMDTCSYLPSLFKDRDAWSSLSASLRQIYPLKDGILWRKVFDGSHAIMVDLPGHPMSISEACVPYQEISSFTASDDTSMPESKTGFILLPDIVKSKSSSSTFCFETHLSKIAKYIVGHSVSQTPMCPASVFHELVVEAAQSAQQIYGESVYVVREMVFAHPLVYDVANEQQALHVILQKAPDTTDLHFNVLSQAYGERSETVHCSGKISAETTSNVKGGWIRKGALVKRQKAHLLAGGGVNLNNFQTKMLYQNIFSRVVDYSEEYQSLLSFSVSESSGEGYGSFRVPVYADMVTGITSPVFIDTLLHAAGFVANTSVRTSEACICGKVESIQSLYGEIDFTQTFTVYCSIFDNNEGTLLADAYAQDSDGKLVAAIEGMHFKRLRFASFKSVLERSIGKSGKIEVPEPQPSRKPEASAVSSAPSTPVDGSMSPATPREATVNHQEVKAKVSRIITEVCEIPEHKVQASTELKGLGVDSLMILELVNAIKKTFPDQDVDDDVLMHCETIADLEGAILSASAGSMMSTAPTSGVETPNDGVAEDDVPDTKARNQHRRSMGLDETHFVQVRKALEKKSPMLLLAKGKSETASLYLFHDGSGMSNMYSQVEDPACDLYGFNNPGFFDSQDQPSTLVDMAKNYASLISASTEKSIILGGYSFGGVVAFQVAHQLREEGKDVEGIILIDSPYPVNHEPLPHAVIAHVSRSLSSKDSTKAVSERVSKQFQANAALLGKYRPPQSSQIVAKVVMLRSRDTFDSEGLCGVRYPWLSDQQTRSQAIAAWEKLVGQSIKVLEIPGNHFEAFTQQNVGPSRSAADDPREADIGVAQISKTSRQIQEAYSWIANM